MMLKHTLAAATFGVLFAAFSPAQAAIQSYTFNGAVDSGSLIGETYSGSFSFDDAALSGIADEWLSVDNLAMSFMGSSYTQANVASGAAVEVGYQDGVFLGLSYSVDAVSIPFTFVAGYADASDAYFAYDNGAGVAGAGSVNYAPVPEPRSWMLILAGVGLVGMMVERSKRRRI